MVKVETRCENRTRSGQDNRTIVEFGFETVECCMEIGEEKEIPGRGENRGDPFHGNADFSPLGREEDGPGRVSFEGFRAIRETDVPNPSTLYGRAKLAAGAMAGQLCAECGVRFAWLRIFSAYGPKDAPNWLIL